MTNPNAFPGALAAFDEMVKQIVGDFDKIAPKLQVEPPEQPAPKVKPLIPRG